MGAETLTKRTEARLFTEILRDLMLAFRGRFEEELGGTGVTLAQLRLLKAVEQHGEGSAASVARACHVTPQTLQAMLTRAAREGWIVRGSSERNHRFVTAALTPAGRGVLQTGLELKERMEAELWEGVSGGTVRAARETLERGLANLRRHGPGGDEGPGVLETRS